MDAFVENSIRAIREKVGNGKVLCALSGGVDSSVGAEYLFHLVALIFPQQAMVNEHTG